MKKWISILVAVMLVLSMTAAFAAEVPSKTTTGTSQVVAMETVSGSTLPTGFAVETVPDTAMTAELIENVYEFVQKEGNAPIDYFEPEVQDEILAHLNANVPATEVMTKNDLKTWVIYEITSVDAINYDESMGDVIIYFDFATPYELDQKMIGILDCFSGERVEVQPNVYEFVSEKFILDSKVVELEVEDENGVKKTEKKVAVTFTKDAILKMQDSVASTLSIFSEPLKEA